MNDRELLELAAKAAGYTELLCPDGWTNDGPWRWHEELKWNPLTDDGDALRLAVKLGIDICPSMSGATKWKHVILNGKTYGEVNECPYAATRRAIVRAAAEIGKEQP